MCLMKLLIIAQFDLMNSRTFKDLCNEIQGFSSTCPVFKYFQGLEFRRKKFKYFQGLSRMHGNPEHRKCFPPKLQPNSNLCNKRKACSVETENILFAKM